MITHRVFLTHNPWPELVPDKVLLMLLETAACKASDQWEEWRASGELGEDRDSFAAVLFDPTRPRWAKTVSDLVYAIILFGPDAERLIKNGACKADGHDRHGINMGDLVQDFSHCLSDGMFAWGYSAEYKRAIGGGSGFSDKQDRELVLVILKSVVDAVIRMRDGFIAEQRSDGSWSWYSADNEPDSEYAQVTELLSAVGTLTTAAAE
jgi:hypothetical protein